MSQWIVCLFLITACAGPQTVAEKAPIVFIHGAHFDGSSWEPVLKALKGQGRALQALNLPDRKTQAVLGLDAAAQRACAQLVQKSILVVHSYGGAIAHQMLGHCPSQVEAILYVTAVAPHPGEMSFDRLSKVDQAGYSSGVDFGAEWVKPKSRAQFLAAMAGPASAATLRSVTFYAEPATLGSEALDFDLVALTGVKRAYVYALQDKIISKESQQRYVEREKIGWIYQVNSGHLPMVTKPAELAEIIADFVAKI